MPIDEGVNVDVQFLIVEVSKQAKASLSYIEKPSSAKLKKIREREDYIDNLKNTLENKSYYHIHRLAEGDRQINYFKALITIAANLEIAANFFENICRQIDYISDLGRLKEYRLRRYYREILSALEMVYPALTEQDLHRAQKICDCEQTIDDMWNDSFATVRKQLRRPKRIDDSLTILFITRYLERVGDALQNIGEAILNVHVGDKMGFRQFRNLTRALEAQGIDIGIGSVEFKSIMNTRSGTRVAKIVGRLDGSERALFYKEGTKEKINDEADSLKRWSKVDAVRVPRLLWHESRKKDSTILLEYIAGNDLLEILISQRGRTGATLDLLATSLVSLWDETRRKRGVKSDYVTQLINRTDDIESVHSQLFNLEPDLEQLLQQARRLERLLRSPFSMLIHGDFNVDNIVYSPERDQIFFVDVHRSGYGDYVQDVSVFLVSNFRVPIFSPDIRQRLNEANARIFAVACAYAEANGDATFHARLALGVFRSLVTSTRFLFDEAFSKDMFLRGIQVLNELLQAADHLQDFKLSPEYVLYR
jgi:phosphate uptake regulator/aminoglycoside phosphotransferase (APT) family kinase protein